MESKNTRETINLLDLFSVSDSELSDLILKAPKKKRVKRRHRSGVRIESNKNFGSCTKSKVQIITLWLAAILITFWLIALSLLAGVLYGEIRRMDISIKSAIAGSEDVPDALQKCHSLSKDLQKNQTILFTHLTEVKAEIANFTIQLSSIQLGLHQMQELLHGVPELASEPKKLDDALTSVATIGSKIQDLQVSVDGLKETDAKLQDAQNILQKNITDTENSLMELSKINRISSIPTNETKLKIDELTQMISQLKTNLTNIDETFSRNYSWIRQEQKKDHEKIVSMQDMMQNVSSTVFSLERSCANASEQAAILLSVNKLTYDAENARTFGANLTNRVQQLEKNYNNLKNITDGIINYNSSMKNEEHNGIIMTGLRNTTANEKITNTDRLSDYLSNIAKNKK